jgi:glucuronoarabinoxylan endo-1,4-beta-xylanase
VAPGNRRHFFHEIYAMICDKQPAWEFMNNLKRKPCIWKNLFFAFVLSTTSATLTVGHAQVVNPPSCTVDGSDVHQRIDGFGASSAFSGSTWTSAQADMFFSTNNNGIGLSLLRNQIQPAATTNAVSFASASERGLMTMAQARGARVWSTPWSPPLFCKNSNTLDGGNYMGIGGGYTNLLYASELAGYVATMQKTFGISIYAISIQNEPDVSTTYASCLWSAQQYHDFTTNLYNALVASNVVSTKIMLPEDEHWQTTFYTTTMNDANVAADVSIIADHNYDGPNFQTGQTTAPAALPNFGKSLWETEVSTGDAFDGSITNAMYWATRIHLFMTVAQANAWHYWWLISGNSDNEGLTDTAGNPAKRMYVLGNFSRFVRPGYFRIGATTSGTTAMISAYQYPNSGNIAIVAINTNATSISQTFTLNNLPVPPFVTPWVTSSNLSIASQPNVTIAGSSFSYTLPAMSVVTFAWETNLPPADITLLNASVSENQPSGTTVGNLLALDPDCANTFTYSLVSGTGSDDNASFSISGSTLKTVASFDYETKKSYTVRIRATDQGGLFTEKVFAIAITDINDTPVFVPIANQTIGAGVTLILTNVATDQDSPPQTLTFSLLNAPVNATLTAANGTNGVFTWRPLVSQADTTNLVSIQVTDNGTPNLSATNNFKITVNPIVQPVLGSVTLASGQVSLVINGPQGPDYTLLTSTNLIDWQALFTTNSPLMPLTLVDTNLNDAARFYRIQIGP